MVRISAEEKRREAADWFKGLIAFVLVLGILLVGYLIYQGIKDRLVLRGPDQIIQQENATEGKIPAQEPIS